MLSAGTDKVVASWVERVVARVVARLLALHERVFILQHTAHEVLAADVDCARANASHRAHVVEQEAVGFLGCFGDCLVDVPDRDGLDSVDSDFAAEVSDVCGRFHAALLSLL